MTNQAEFLQHNITIEFLPYGSDMPYRIIVGNNPVNKIDPLGLIWVTIEHDYPNTSNYLTYWFNRFVRGLDSQIQEQDAANVRRTTVQEWQRDPKNSCRDSEYPTGTLRRVPQKNILYFRKPGESAILKNMDDYYLQWTPNVSSPTYETYPGIKYENLFYWRQGK